jgi:hypothetical protein
MNQDIFSKLNDAQETLKSKTDSDADEFVLALSSCNLSLDQVKKILWLAARECENAHNMGRLAGLKEGVEMCGEFIETMAKQSKN